MKVSIPAALSAAAVAVLCVGTAHADEFADKSRSVTTEDGRELRVTKTSEIIDRVPNLAAAPLSREAFVSLTGVVDILGDAAAPVHGGKLELGYQLGCQTDVTSLTTTLATTVGPNASVIVGPVPGMSIGGTATATPSLALVVKPGSITDIPLGSKTLVGTHGSISIDQAHIKVDGCLGQVSLRSYATVSISTDAADNSTAVYGDPIWL